MTFILHPSHQMTNWKPAIWVSGFGWSEFLGNNPNKLSTGKIRRCGNCKAYEIKITMLGEGGHQEELEEKCLAAN